MGLVVNKILVPLDFSQASVDALDYAVRIAEIFKSEIILLHVVETYEFNSSYRDDETAREIIQMGLNKKFDEIMMEHSNSEDLKVSHAHRVGKIYNQINLYAEEESCDLIVMGTHGTSSNSKFKKFMLGSNANRVIHGAPCPVLTVKNKNHSINFNKILLPIDITKETEQKVAFAIAIAKTFDSEIHILAASSYIDEYQDNISKLTLKLNEVADEVTTKGIKCFTCIERNENVPHAIFEYSEKNDIDLVVIMTRQEKKWEEFLLGSNAKKVIVGSDTPTLSLQPKEGK